MLPRLMQVEGTEANYHVFCGNDFITNHLVQHGVWEELFLEICKDVLKHYDEPLVLDIGAHIGSFAVPIAKSIAGRQGAVICFEPQRITFLQLCANIFLNRIDNCYPHNCAIADTDGVCEIPEIDFYNCINASAFSMHQKYRELHGIEQAMRKETHSVPQLSLDSLEVDSLVSLVKIDVEGLELQVLTGGIDFFE